MHKAFWKLVLALGVLAVGPTAILAQAPAGPDSSAEFGVRFTPGMASAIGRMIVKEVLVKRYELPWDQKDPAAEAIARRLMQVAHTCEKDGQALFEFYATEVTKFMAGAREGEEIHGIPPQFGVGFGQRAMPMLPATRELIRNVGQDIRPMLPLASQLKLGKDLMTVHTAVDAFEKTMERWSEGDVNPFEDPFGDDEKIERDENGQSEQYKAAAERAAKKSDIEPKIAAWRRYVERAAELYDFEESQSATAESILTEVIERAEILAADERRQERAYRSALWEAMRGHLPTGWRNPLRYFVDKHQESVADPITALEEELKSRIDRIPTRAQRRLADETIETVLAKQGFEMAEEQSDD